MSRYKRANIDLLTLKALREEGRTYDEIAQLLGTTHAVVYIRLKEMGMTRPNHPSKEDRFISSRLTRWKLSMPWIPKDSTSVSTD